MGYIDVDLSDRIKKLPPDLQKAIEDLDVFEKMMEIRDKYNLLISEGGDLYEEVKKVLLSEHKADDFFKNIQQVLPVVDKNTLVNITAEVDNQIFAPIKQNLMRIEGQKPKTPADELEPIREEDHSQLKKDDMLREIEAPTPAPSRRVFTEAAATDFSNIKMPSHNLSSITERLRNRDLEMMTEAKHLEKMKEEALAENLKRDMRQQEIEAEEKRQSSGFVEEKLTETVRTPRQEIKVEPPASTSPDAPKPRSIDPYREQI